MKKWLNYFFLGFFSHKTAKEGARRGFTNTFLGFVLALVLVWAGFVGGDMLPFGAHYSSSTDFRAAVHGVLASPDADKRITLTVKDGSLRAGRAGGDYASGVVVNTLDSAADAADYATGGYNIVIDTRPADTLAAVDAYCISNDGKQTRITYAEYLTLSEVARMNFDFKLTYTGDALVLDAETVAGYAAYLSTAGEDSRTEAERLAAELADGKITEGEYMRSVYELYFAEYYPSIKEYESSSAVPLLRNYYFHEYIDKGMSKYLFIFDDYIAGSFMTDGGLPVTFYGFFGGMEDGVAVGDGLGDSEAEKAADGFIKACFRANSLVILYAHVVNTASLVPFLALMLLVAALLSYSLMRLRGIGGITSLGAVLRIVGGFTWFSALVSAVLSVLSMFFLDRALLVALIPVIFFLVLTARSMLFVFKEARRQDGASEAGVPEQVA